MMGMSIKGCARIVGVDPKQVRRAIVAGNIERRSDGLIDPAQAQAWAARRQRISCIQCGKPFSRPHTRQTLCSVECKRARQLQQQLDHRLRHSVLPVVRVCTECGELFTRQHNRQEVCSLKCRAERQRQHDRNSAARRRGDGAKVCLQCLKVFIPRNANSKTCSAKCSLERRLAVRRVWRACFSDEERARASDYQSSWKAELSPEKRAEYRATARAYRARVVAAMTPEEREARLLKRRMSPWEVKKRLSRKGRPPKFKLSPQQRYLVERERKRARRLRERDEARAYRKIMASLKEGLDDNDLNRAD